MLAVNKYSIYNTKIPLKVWGWATYAAHKWIDRIKATKIDLAKVVLFWTSFQSSFPIKFHGVVF